MVEIIIGGDLVPTKSNEILFRSGDIDSLIGKDLKELWNSVNIRMFNLEVPLTDSETPISKCGPNLIASTNTIKGIKSLDPTLITLANNHILDQGIAGYRSTINILEENDIPFIGVGENIKEAYRPYIFEENGLSIGVYACAENEFTIATDNTAGANPFDPLESLDHIDDLKKRCDYVIVLFHGGKEHYRYPSPNLQKVCRKIVEKGADVVICQHSHCIGCFEKYRNGTIVYGQGNFIFDRKNIELWQTSLLIKLKITNKIDIEYIPVVKKENKIRLAQHNEASEILFKFQDRSMEIKKEGFVEKKYSQFADERILVYLKAFSGMNKWLSIIDQKLLKGVLVRKKYNKKNFLLMQNYIECEAHRELFLNAIKGAKASEE